LHPVLGYRSHRSSRDRQKRTLIGHPAYSRKKFNITQRAPISSLSDQCQLPDDRKEGTKDTNWDSFQWKRNNLFARLQFRLSITMRAGRESVMILLIITRHSKFIRSDPAELVQQISMSSGWPLFVPPFSRRTGILNHIYVLLFRIEVLLPFPLGTSDDTSFTGRGVSTGFKAGEQVFSYPLTYSLCLSGWANPRLLVG
jgi:hypothetical protein